MIPLLVLPAALGLPSLPLSVDPLPASAPVLATAPSDAATAPAETSAPAPDTAPAAGGALAEPPSPPATAPGGAPVTAPAPAPAATPATPAATPTVSAWSLPLRQRPRPVTSEVLRQAPVFGTVRLVTVREQNGRPVATDSTAPNRAQATAAVARALSDPTVLAISLAEEVHAEATGPDPLRGQQWALDRLQADQVWALQNATGVTVAVVDSGVDAGHPDLAGVVLPGTDLVTAGNGQSDPYGHGTHVAGVIAAVRGNALGIAGLAPGARILPVRVLDAAGNGSDADLANGIVWAVDHGARVINLSVGSPDYSPAEAAAVAYAVQKGAVVIASAGNERAKGNPVMYPAAFPSVIGVAATGTDNRTLSFSSSGSYVDLAAPGTGIVSTYRRGYSALAGTSASAPLVSATAALVRAAAPGLSNIQVASLLTSTAQDVETTGRDNLSGSGLVRPLVAVTQAKAIARGAAVPPATPTKPTPAVIAVTSAPARAGYASTVTATFRIAAGGAPLASARVSICQAMAPATKATCVAATSTASGLVTRSVVLTGHLSLWVQYAGTTRIGPAMSAPRTIQALPSATVRAGTKSFVLTLRPVAPNERIGIQRRSGSTWVGVTTKVIPTSGVLTVTGLVSGGVYRASIPATDRTLAATTSAVTVK